MKNNNYRQLFFGNKKFVFYGLILFVTIRILLLTLYILHGSFTKLLKTLIQSLHYTLKKYDK